MASVVQWLLPLPSVPFSLLSQTHVLRMFVVGGVILTSVGSVGSVSAQAASYCAPGQAPEFTAGFAALRAHVGEMLGEPVTCEFADPSGSGDVHQLTTNGLAYWRQRTNTPTFTNGVERWALTQIGLVYWTGGGAEPPGTVESSTPEAPAGEPMPLDPPASADDRSRIPAWLQATWTAPLYANHEGAETIATLRTFAYLHVYRAGTYRLQVQALSANGQPAVTGWVDPFDVQPSEPGEGWLQGTGAIEVLASAEPDAWLVGVLGPGTYVRQIGEPMLGRVPVRVYAPDFSAVAATGWVSQDHVHSVAPPQASLLVLHDRLARPNPFAGNPLALIDAVASAADALRPESTVPVSVTVAQAILESAWGESALAREANNYLGVKAFGRLGNDGVVWFTTEEYDPHGNLYVTLDPFRAYKSLADSVVDHHELLQVEPGYRAAMEVAHDPRAFAHALQEVGYSTDPDYAQKLIDLMDRYNLYRFD